MKVLAEVQRMVLSLLSPAGQRGRLTVLQFHRVPLGADGASPGEMDLPMFERVLDLVAEQFRVLPLADAIQALGQRRLPSRAMALSFDDGYAEWLQHVAPVLQRRGMHATFFVTTDQLQGGAMWHERVHAAVLALPCTGFVLPEGLLGYRHLDSEAKRQQLSTAIQEHMKYMPVSQRDADVLALEAQAAGSLPQFSPFSADSVRALHAGGFDIGAHTIHHPILNRVPADEARREIGGSREALQAIVRAPVRLFAYPNGRPVRDFNVDHVRMVRECGFEGAVCTGGGAARAGTDPFLVPRFTPWGPTLARMTWQLGRNLVVDPRLSAVDAPGRQRRVLVVENGAGFGGAVVALQTLLRQMPTDRIAFDVVLNEPMKGFDVIPAVRSCRVINDELIDFSPWQAAVSARTRGLPRKMLTFGIGRLDDVFNRLPYLLRLAAHARRVAPDVIHGNNEPVSNREAMIVARLLSIPSVQHLRGPYPPSRQQRRLLQQPGAFIAVSRWLADDLLRDGVPPQRVRQIYDAIELQHASDDPQTPTLRDELGLSPSAPLVAMVGMLVPWKGQALFIEAAARCAQRAQDATFLIIGGLPNRGDPAYPARLEELAGRAGLGSRLRLLGQRRGMPALMRQLDVVVSASTQPEPLGLVMLEAMASGCRFVGPAFGAAVEVIDHGRNGFLFAPGSAPSLAEAIAAALAVGDRSAVADAAVQSVTGRFAGPRCRDLTLEVYNTVAPMIDWTSDDRSAHDPAPAVGC